MFGKRVLRKYSCVLTFKRLLFNFVLRKIFGPKKDEVEWEWRKLYNERVL